MGKIERPFFLRRLWRFQVTPSTIQIMLMGEANLYPIQAQKYGCPNERRPEGTGFEHYAGRRAWGRNRLPDTHKPGSEGT